MVLGFMILKIAKDFSFTPGPRYIKEGDYSGELFRETHLKNAVLEAMETGEKLVIDLDGSAGYGRSFLEESFGGLIREDKLPYEKVINALEIKSEEETYLKDKIFSYLKNAHEQQKRQNN